MSKEQKEKEIKPIEKQLVHAYLKLKRKKDAYREVYGTEGDASRILNKPQVQKYMDECLEDDLDGALMDYREMMRFLTLIVRTDIGSYFDENGRPKSYEDLTDDQRLIVREQVCANGKSVITTYDKLDAMSLMLKTKLSTDKSTDTGQVMNVNITI